MGKIGKIIKYICFVTLIVVCAAIIVRICIMTDTSRLSDITPNDILNYTYINNSNIEVLEHDVYDEISKEGYFGAYALIYIQECNQLQITIRYNDSIYSYNDFENDKEFYFYLYDSVNEVETLLLPSCITKDDKLMYNYRRLVFNDVDISDGGDYYIYIAYVDKDSSEVTKEECFDNIPIHYSSQEWTEYKLSKTEKSSLSN